MKKELVKYITLECQTKIIKLLIFFNSTNNTTKLNYIIFYVFNCILYF